MGTIIKTKISKKAKKESKRFMKDLEEVLQSDHKSDL